MSTRVRKRSRTKTPIQAAAQGAQLAAQGAQMVASAVGQAQQRASTTAPKRVRNRSRSRSATSRRSSGAVTTGGTTMAAPSGSLAIAAPLARECYNLLGRGLTKQQITSFVNAL